MCNTPSNLSSQVLALICSFALLGGLLNTTLASEQKSIDVNGTNIIYVEQGNGPLMILAHGALSDHRRWIKDHMPLLAEDYRVVSYSMRYHANQDWDDEWPPLTMDLYADDLAGLITALDDGPAHLVGWSMGARVAHRTALSYPEVVRSAYLFEGAAAMVRSPTQMEEHNRLRSQMMGKSMALANEGKHKEAAAALLDGVIGKDGFFESLPEGPQKVLGSKGRLLADLFKTLDNPTSTFTCEQIQKSDVPTVYVMGDSTRDYFSVAIGKHYEPCFGSDRIMVIPGAHHLWPGAKHADFVASVKEFASKH